MGTGTDMGDHELCTYFKTKKFALFKIISTNYINDKYHGFNAESYNTL